MKGKFKLSFRRVKRVVKAGNSERNLVLRSLYAQKMLEIYGQGKHVINIDESWIPETDFRRRRWASKGGQNSMAEKTMGHRVNMIVAVSASHIAYKINMTAHQNIHRTCCRVHSSGYLSGAACIHTVVTALLSY